MYPIIFLNSKFKFLRKLYALEDSLGVYELLIAGLMDKIYQSDAYETLSWVLVKSGKKAFISGEQRKKAKF